MFKGKLNNCKFHCFVILSFVALQLLLITVLYDSNPEVSSVSEPKTKKLIITFLNASISDYNYDQLSRQFCKMKYQQRTVFIQNPRLIKDNVGIFIPVLNVSTLHLISTLHQLTSASLHLKLVNSVTLVFDASKNICHVVASISNLFKFDIKIGFLKLLRLPNLFEHLSNEMLGTRQKSSHITDVQMYIKLNNEQFADSLKSAHNFSINTNKNSETFLNKNVDGKINFMDVSLINIYVMHLITDLFNDSFKYYLHLSAESRMPQYYLSAITKFLSKEQAASRQTWIAAEFGAQEFPSGLVMRASEVSRFTKYVLSVRLGGDEVMFNSRGIGTTTFFINLYTIYLRIVTQARRIIYLPPIFHSTNPMFESEPDPNPPGNVFTNLHTLTDKNSLLTGAGLVVDHPRGGDQIIILFATGVILNTLQWSVTYLRKSPVKNEYRTDSLLLANRTSAYFESNNYFGVGETYSNSSVGNDLHIEPEIKRMQQELKFGLDKVHGNKKRHFSLSNVLGTTSDNIEANNFMGDVQLKAFVEASPVLMRIDKKSSTAKCADYQLLGSFNDSRLEVGNLTHVIGRIATRCLKLTVVKDVNFLVKFGRISIRIFPSDL